jgi:type I restriction enzyme S subunit
MKSGKININDILVVKDGATTGKVSFVDNNFPFYDAAINEHVFLVRTKPQLNPKYLFHFFYSDNGQQLILNDFRGATVGGISRNFIDMEIPLPPLPIQKEIADILDIANTLIEKRKAQIEKLDLLVKSQFIEMFGDPITNPMGWELGTIRDIVSDVKYGTSSPASEHGKHIYLRMNNITYDGHLDLSNLKYINVEEKDYEKHVVRKGDLLFNRTNSKELVGKTCVFKEDTEMIIAGYIIRVRTNQKANPEFVSALLNSKYGKVTLYDMCKAIVGQANINAQEVQQIRTYIPPHDLQDRFASFVERVEAQKAQLKKSLELMELNYKSLMQKCFNGELVK